MGIDTNTIKELIDKNDYDSIYINELVDNLVNKCCGSLDKYIEYVSKILNDTNYDVSDKELEDITMTIPTLLYYVGTQQEKIGVKRDISESSKNLLYNEIFSSLSGTAGAKKSVAELKIVDEEIVVFIFTRAYNIVKSKVTYAFEVLQSAKKVMSRRIAESELTKVANVSIPINKKGRD